MKKTTAGSIKAAGTVAAFILIMSMLLSGCGKKNTVYSTADSYDSYMAESAEEAVSAPAAMGTGSLQKSAGSNATFDETDNYSGDGDIDSKSMTEVGEAVDEDALIGEAAGKDSYVKLIKSANITMETTQLDELTADITRRVNELGGYIEYSWLGDNGYNNDDTRYVNYTLRIPADRLDDFLNTALTAGKITSRSENVENITLKYSDLESRVRTLETEQERLLELIKDAQDVDAIIALETRLSEIRYELDSIKSSLKLYDNQVAYSTVTLYISEVRVVSAAKSAGFAEKVTAGLSENLVKLKEALENAVITLIISIPAIIVFIIFAVIALLIIRLVLRVVLKILGIKMPHGIKRTGKEKKKSTEAEMNDNNSAEQSEVPEDKNKQTAQKPEEK